MKLIGSCRRCGWCCGVCPSHLSFGSDGLACCALQGTPEKLAECVDWPETPNEPRPLLCGYSWEEPHETAPHRA